MTRVLSLPAFATALTPADGDPPILPPIMGCLTIPMLARL
jgi:hypothetical protein